MTVHQGGASQGTRPQAAAVIAIAVNVFAFVVLAVLVFLGFSQRSKLSACENTQSPYCYSIQCPADPPASGPCFGYASRPGPTSGTFYCSSSPTTAVDKDGKPV